MKPKKKAFIGKRKKMSFVNYKNTNNAYSKLIAGISANATTVLITDGDQSIFPDEFPFLLTIEHEDANGNVTAREIVKVTGMNQNSLVIERGAGKCVQDDTASSRTQANTPHSFSAGDKISLYFTSEQVQDIQSELGNKASSSELSTLDEKVDGVQENVDGVIEEINKIKSDGVPTNCLSETGIVGEKYNISTDTLFKQYDTTYDEAIVPFSISDTQANSQIHIQKISSGISSNRISLKLRKVGEPTTNLEIKVLKGQKLEYTSECVRYGTGNSLGSATISYQDITTDFAQYTITLDETINVERGELLDVVLCMSGGIVNSSNYYQIACSSSQRSEAFRLIGYNTSNSSMSSTYYMPFCRSGAFEKSLLCKASSVQKTVSSGTETQLYKASGTKTSGSYPYTLQSNMSVKITASRYQQQSSSIYYTCGTITYADPVKGTGTIVTMSATTSQASGSWTGDYNKGCVLTMTVDGGSNRRVVDYTIYQTGYVLTKNTNGYAPNTNKSIGQDGSVIIFGMNGQNFYVGPTTTNYVAGSITLGNAVGFVNIGGKKIPYYN